MTPRRRRRRKRGSEYEELVATVAQAMSDGAMVQHGVWFQGPDGRRDMDVVVRGTLEGQPRTVLIECKDFTPKSTGKVGIEYVDALDSKRRELSVDAALLCSNSGFTEGALRKAKRVGIGLISVLKRGDPRVKLRITEEIYFRHVRIGTIRITIHFTEDVGLPDPAIIERLRYKGGLVTDWARERVGLITAANPAYSGDPATVSHSFSATVTLEADGLQFLCRGVTLEFAPEIEWRAQTVTLDATLGLYDYLRGRVRLAPGEQQYVINGVDIHGGTPIDFVPPTDTWAASLVPGEVGISMCLIDGAPKGPPPLLTELIVEADRSVIIAR